ncbi:hypothetical protein ACS0TY_027960 [Phlomoides rotata]
MVSHPCNSTTHLFLDLCNLATPTAARHDPVTPTFVPLFLDLCNLATPTAEFLIYLLLTILGYVPGIIYALYAIVFIDRDRFRGDNYYQVA